MAGPALSAYIRKQRSHSQVHARPPAQTRRHQILARGDTHILLNPLRSKHRWQPQPPGDPATAERHFDERVEVAGATEFSYIWICTASVRVSVHARGGACAFSPARSTFSFCTHGQSQVASGLPLASLQSQRQKLSGIMPHIRIIFVQPTSKDYRG